MFPKPPLVAYHCGTLAELMVPNSPSLPPRKKLHGDDGYSCLVSVNMLSTIDWDFVERSSELAPNTSHYSMMLFTSCR